MTDDYGNDLNKAAEIIVKMIRPPQPERLHFGEGKVLIGFGSVGDSEAVVFVQTDEARPIGEYEGGETYQNNGVEFVFSNIESVRAVKTALERIEAKFQEIPAA
jgi:hypothetical protein